jgi:hypothetical protein
LLLAAAVFYVLEQQQELQSLCRLAYPPQLCQGFKAAKGEPLTSEHDGTARGARTFGSGEVEL